MRSRAQVRGGLGSAEPGVSVEDGECAQRQTREFKADRGVSHGWTAAGREMGGALRVVDANGAKGEVEAEEEAITKGRESLTKGRASRPYCAVER